jgi:MFS transporter, DHA1 family, inner membrane transport protein
LLKRLDGEKAGGIGAELAAMWNLKLWIALFTTVFGFGGVFVILTYIAPILRDISHFSSQGVTTTLFVFGAGLTIGNTLGGRLADKSVMGALIATLIGLSLLQLIFGWAMFSQWSTYVLVFLWGIAAFATIAPLQTRVVRSSPDAPALASSLNISGFNLGNAGGAFIGGTLIARGFALPNLAIAGAAVTFIGLLLALASAGLDRSDKSN